MVCVEPLGEFARWRERPRKVLDSSARIGLGWTLDNVRSRVRPLAKSVSVSCVCAMLVTGSSSVEGVQTSFLLKK